MKNRLGLGLWNTLVASGALCALTACGGGGESDGSGGGETTSTSGATTDASTSTGDAGGASGDGGAGATTASTGDTSSSTGSSGGGAISQCTTANLFAGNPYYDGELEGADPAGQVLLGDPPLRVVRLSASGSSLLIDTGPELWIASDVDAAEPTAVRIAGIEPGGEEASQYLPSGPCADLRVISGQGSALLPNGNAVFVDQVGNGLIEISGIGTASCSGSPIAGQGEAVLESDIDEDVADPGDADGPGSDAKFHAPRTLTSDAAGNVYLVDEGNWKVKKVASDAARTVTTLGGLQEFFDAADGNVLSLVALGDKVYATGHSHGDDVLVGFDTGGGGGSVVYAERPHFPEQDSSQTALIAGAGSDGAGLVLYGSLGYVWKVDLDGSVAATLGGSGLVVDFPEGLGSEVPVGELPLKTASTQVAPLAVVGSSVFVAAVNNGVGQHVWRLDCE